MGKRGTGSNADAFVTPPGAPRAPALAVQAADDEPEEAGERSRLSFLAEKLGTLLGLTRAKAAVAAPPQKRGTDSAFDPRDRQRQERFLGTSWPTRDDEEISRSDGRIFDGSIPAKEVTSREVWKRVTPPVQSRPGRRSAALYQTVIDQFAVGSNPRYVPDEPAKPRTHIFISDVTRAMGAEIPHFLGARELTLAQTCDWIRHEGPMNGWRRTDQDSALRAADAGMPVLVLPKDVRVKLIALARPTARTPDGRPLMAGAVLLRGNYLSSQDAFAVTQVEYFIHS